MSKEFKTLSEIDLNNLFKLYEERGRLKERSHFIEHLTSEFFYIEEELTRLTDAIVRVNRKINNTFKGENQ